MYDNAGNTAIHIEWNVLFRVQGRQPIILLLDDNMIYHSIRHEYYQMARKC